MSFAVTTTLHFQLQPLLPGHVLRPLLAVARREPADQADLDLLHPVAYHYLRYPRAINSEADEYLGGAPFTIYRSNWKGGSLYLQARIVQGDDEYGGSAGVRFPIWLCSLAGRTTSQMVGWTYDDYCGIEEISVSLEGLKMGDHLGSWDELDQWLAAPEEDPYWKNPPWAG